MPEKVPHIKELEMGGFKQLEMPRKPMITKAQKDLWVCECYNAISIGDPIPVMVNGEDKELIPTGTPVLLTKGQIEAIKHANFTDYEPKGEIKPALVTTEVQMIPIRRQRFIVSVIRKATKKDREKAFPIPTEDLFEKGDEK